MIVRMSKIEIAGEKSLLQSVLDILRESGLFQIEPATVGFREGEHEEDIRAFLPDEKTLYERMFFEEVRSKIEQLFSFLPALSVRRSYIEPVTILDTIAKTLDRHKQYAGGLSEKRAALVKERSELEKYSVFLKTIAPLVASARDASGIDFIGLTLREPDAVEPLRQALSRITDWKYELHTEQAEDGTLVGLIAVEKDASDKVKKSLSDQRVPELIFPESFGNLTFPQKLEFVRSRLLRLRSEIGALDDLLAEFTLRWAPIYRRVREWIDDK